MLHGVAQDQDFFVLGLTDIPHTLATALQLLTLFYVAGLQHGSRWFSWTHRISRLQIGCVLAAPIVPKIELVRSQLRWTCCFFKEVR